MKTHDYRCYLEKYTCLTPNLEKYSRNLNLLALNNKLSKAYGRENEINKIQQIFLRRTKRNPLLIGKAGVGKTAIIEQLAINLKDEVLKSNEDIIQTPVIFELSLNSMVSGSKYRGVFEERIEKILDEIEKNPEVIIFIDEIHNIVKSGAAEGCLAVGEILKPALARGNMRVIGATTTDEISLIKEDKALMRRFSPIFIDELQGEMAVDCVENILVDYKKFFNIELNKDISPNNLYTVVNEICKSVPFPDNLIDILDETLSEAKFNNQTEINFSDLKKTLTRQTGMLVI